MEQVRKSEMKSKKYRKTLNIKYRKILGNRNIQKMAFKIGKHIRMHNDKTKKTT